METYRAFLVESAENSTGHAAVIRQASTVISHLVTTLNAHTTAFVRSNRDYRSQPKAFKPVLRHCVSVLRGEIMNSYDNP